MNDPILGQYSPEEYAALWGCDPAYDLPPRKPGDGYLFYNFGSELQSRTREWLMEFAGAIERTIAGVRMRGDAIGNPDLDDDLEGLSDLLEHVKGLASKAA